MAMNDPIADFLTRIRNAQLARHRIVEIPASNIKKRMTEILFKQGFIHRYKFVSDDKQGVIKIALKYDRSTQEPAIREMKRLSKPGLRLFSGASDIPRVKNGLGIAIVSTSRGVLTDKEARKMNIGGEVLCSIN
jgi:small subunit ribosomal protein S8